MCCQKNTYGRLKMDKKKLTKEKYIIGTVRIDLRTSVEDLVLYHCTHVISSF